MFTAPQPSRWSIGAFFFFSLPETPMSETPIEFVLSPTVSSFPLFSTALQSKEPSRETPSFL
tara:strand:+ start:1942 stop:2127 length:186 start_codon:yes stop_codon:yes gene_type:complete